MAKTIAVALTQQIGFFHYVLCHFRKIKGVKILAAKKSSNKQQYKRHTMKEKYQFHANRAFENRMPKGSHMTPEQKAAYSAGYAKHARDSMRIDKYNSAIACGYSQEDAKKFANSKNSMIDWNTGRIVDIVR